MKRYSSETRNNFISAPKFNINDINIKEAYEVSGIGDRIKMVIDVTDSEILTAIEALNIKSSDLIQEDFCSTKTNHYGKLVEDASQAVREFYDKYERIRRETYYLYIIPQDYLNLYEGKILSYLIPKKFPEIFEDELFNKEVDNKIDFENFGEFLTYYNIRNEDSIDKVFELLKNNNKKPAKELVSKFSIHANYGGKMYEIYLETEFGSLYVPLKAIEDKDFNLIEKRMKDYFSWYYNKSKENYDKAMKAIESKEAIRLKELFNK